MAAHKDCIAAGLPAPVPRLTGAEHAKLIHLCFDHPIATCVKCGCDYRVTELGADVLVLAGHYDRCPFCRADLTWSIRQHIAVCAVVRVSEPRWQAEVREALARARELRKAS